MRKILILTILLLPFVSFAQTTASEPLTPEELQYIQEQFYNDVENFINQSGSAIDPNTGLPQTLQENLSIEVFPEIPQPNQDVQISLSSLSVNLDGSYITWSRNGEIIDEGLGIKTIIFRALGTGVRNTVVVTIDKPAGGTIQKTITFTPSEVHIMYEAKTYTPPFYKGSPIFTRESDVEFHAITNFVNQFGAKVDPDTLNYIWKVDNIVVSEISGAGRNTVTYRGSVVDRPTTVSVEVISPDSTLQGEASVYLEPLEPEVLIYENNPLYGPIFEQAAVGSFMMDRSEINLMAIPYFFSADNRRSPDLNFTWETNSGLVTNHSSADLTLRNDTGNSGVENVSVLIDNSSRIIQSAQNGLTLLLETNLSDFSF